MIKSVAGLAFALLTATGTAHADGPETLLKRVDVKSWEGFLQVTPKETKNVDLDVNFIRPAYDTQPTTAGAMVGLIQTASELSNFQFKVDPDCRGELTVKLGLQEFGGGNVGYLKTIWTADPGTDKLSLSSQEFQARGGSVEDINPTLITGRMSKGQWISIKLPVSLAHTPGDILVMDQLRYTSATDTFSSCKLSIREGR